MSDINLYKAYTDDNVLNSNPLGLVIALYEGGLDSIRSARACFESQDIAGRAKAINKTFAILTELMTSLDHKKGGEISKNLGNLYDYMQRRVLDAQAKKNPAPLVEVENLMSTLLDGWKKAGNSFDPQSQAGSSLEMNSIQESIEPESEYASYFAEQPEFCGRPAYSF